MIVTDAAQCEGISAKVKAHLKTNKINIAQLYYDSQPVKGAYFVEPLFVKTSPNSIFMALGYAANMHVFKV